MDTGEQACIKALREDNLFPQLQINFRLKKRRVRGERDLMKNEEMKKRGKKCQQWQVLPSQEDHECGSLMCVREEKVVLENMRAAKWSRGEEDK